MPRLRVHPPAVPVAAQWLLRVDGDVVVPGRWTPVAPGRHEVELHVSAPVPAGTVRGTCRWTVAVADGADVDVRLPDVVRHTPLDAGRSGGRTREDTT